MDPIPAAMAPGGITVGLETVMSGLLQPTVGATAPGDPDHLYGADQVGKVWVVDVSHRRHPQAPRLFLDISGRLVTLGLWPRRSMTSRACWGRVPPQFPAERPVLHVCLRAAEGGGDVQHDASRGRRRTARMCCWSGG